MASANSGLGRIQVWTVEWLAADAAAGVRPVQMRPATAGLNGTRGLGMTVS